MSGENTGSIGKAGRGGMCELKIQNSDPVYCLRRASQV